mmetsp:Transcript_49071/g.129655  ORF Transcript_49071/g.129655 Transcript_49071/m.129655 type:complete len:343 (-) Transcript_49071:86-1114(-)
MAPTHKGHQAWVTAPEPTTGCSFILTTAGIIVVYSCIIAAVHQFWLQSETGGAAAPGGNVTKDFWGNEGQPFDAPEPNYMYSSFIAEFWSVLTVFPMAGVHLLRLAFHYGYNWKVKVMAGWTTWMYSLALFSHMTLYTMVNQVTCGSVITNAIYALCIWGGIAGKPLSWTPFRLFVAFSCWCICVWGLYHLPFVLKPVGGVYTLFVVQTPPVVFAFFGAMIVYWRWSEQCKSDSVLFWGLAVLVVSGFMLTCAMGLSLVEVYFGESHGVLAPETLGIPWMHLTIHVLEQLGIYGYGVGVASVEHTLQNPTPCSMEFAFGVMPYVALGKADRPQLNGAKSKPE